MIKQVIVIRKDLNMRKGKIGAQSAHASMKIFFNRAKIDNGVMTINLNQVMQEWITGLFTKIVVYVNSEQELFDVYNRAKEADIICSLIQDAGLTEFKEPTYTAIAIGPDYDDKINLITGHLPLL